MTYSINTQKIYKWDTTYMVFTININICMLIIYIYMYIHILILIKYI